MSLAPSQDALRRRCYHPSGGFTAFPRSALELSVPERFEQQARQHGDRLAVESADARYTYSQLNGLANDVAHGLRMATTEASPYVAVLTDHGAMNLAGLLGTLKAGRAFVPLDPQWPAARMRWVLDHCRAQLIVASRRHAPLARDASGPTRRVLLLDELATAAGRENPGVPIDVDAPAYVLYTSGSTGRPKGVRHSHRALSHEVLRLTNGLSVCADDRQSLLRANSAGAISDAFTALLNGAAVCPIDVHEAGPDGLASWVARERVTIWRSTPSLFRAVWGALPATALLPHLRLVFLCGEPVNGSDLEAWRAHAAPAGLLVNCLGSTECATVTLFLCGTDTPAESGPVPLGDPVDDMDVDLVDESGAVLRGAGSGELVVRSRYLADGYVGEPELTARSFRDDPTGAGRRLYLSGDIGTRLNDGHLVYLGRKGARANLLGRTFELAEVETALQSMAGVREVVAAVVADARDVSHLVAYVVSDPLAAPSSAALQLHAQERLPPFMVPKRFVFVDRLPLTATGKADRRALPNPFATQSVWPSPSDDRLGPIATVDESRTPTDAQLAAL
jgi:amino acid adenylation domain-containing protein